MFKSLYTKLIAVNLLLVFLPMLFIGYISYQSKKEAIMTQLEQMIILSADNLVVAIQDIIGESIGDAGFLASNPVISSSHSSPEEINQVLEKFLASYPMYKSVILLDSQGIVITDMLGRLEGQDLSSRTWFNRVMSEERVIFSDIYYSPLVEGPVLPLGAPVVDESGNIIRVISPSLNLNHLWKRIERFTSQQKNLGLNGYAFLVNGQGDIITYPDQSQILKNNYFAYSGLSADELKILNDTGGIYYLKNDTTINSVACISQVPGFENDWHVIVSVPENELYAPLNKLLSKYIILFSLILLTTVVFVIRLAKYIVAPVNSLVEATGDFIGGKKVKLNQSTYREINILNDAFNTMLKKLSEREQELIRAERLKTIGQLSAGFAHEIRNPLATIRGFIQLIDRYNQENSRDKQYYGIIIKEIDRINCIVGDLLALAKSGVDSNLTETDLNGIIDEVVLLYQPQGAAVGISLVTEFSPLPSVCTDPNQLKQVFINIIKNAFESMPGTGGSIIVSTSFLEDEQAVKIQFIDNGCGMDKETLERIGTPFFTTKESGTGLGLLTSYRIIKDLEGTLLIQSELNKGSVFTIKLPVELSYGSAKNVFKCG